MFWYFLFFFPRSIFVGIFWPLVIFLGILPVWGLGTFRRWRKEWAEYWIWMASWPVLIWLDTFGNRSSTKGSNEDWARWAREYWQARYTLRRRRGWWWMMSLVASVASGILLYTIVWASWHQKDGLPFSVVAIASALYVAAVMLWSHWAGHLPSKEQLLCNVCNVSSVQLCSMLEKLPPSHSSLEPGWNHPTKALNLRKEFGRTLFASMPVLFLLLEKTMPDLWLFFVGVVALLCLWFVWGALARLSYPLVRYRLAVEGPDEFCVQIFRADLEEVCRSRWTRLGPRIS